MVVYIINIDIFIISFLSNYLQFYVILNWPLFLQYKTFSPRIITVILTAIMAMDTMIIVTILFYYNNV